MASTVRDIRPLRTCYDSNWQLQDIVFRFFQRIARRPPLIVTNCPAPSEVIHMLTLLKAMSAHLSSLPLTFSTRITVLESKWSQILQWLTALLMPLSDFIDPTFPANELYSDATSRCVVEVFTFLNAIASARTSTDVELTTFSTRLASSPEMLAVIANTWVAFFTRPWPIIAHCEVTPFLVMFGHMICNTTFEHSFLVAVRNVCPDCEFLPMWSAAIAELCAQPVTPIANRMIQTVNRGLLIAATTTFFRPLPMLNEIHITLAQTYKLWNQLMANSYPPGLCYTTFHSFASFSLFVISGGPNWATEALDADILVLLMRTLAWIPTAFSEPPDESIHDVTQETLRLLLVYSIYKPVRRGILSNLKKVQSQQLEELLGVGTLKQTWDDLVGEIHSPAECYTSAICFEKALENICSNEEVNNFPLHQHMLFNIFIFSALMILCPAITPSSVAAAALLVIAPPVANENIGERSIRPFVQNSTHPNDFPHNDRGPVDLGDLNRFQLLFRALIQIKRDREEIRRSISNQGLQSSPIMIEFSFTTYPWTWKVFDQDSFPTPQLHSTEIDFRPPMQDTLVAVKCPCTVSTANYFVRGVDRATLLNPAHELVDEGVGGQELQSLDDVLLSVT
ncbi:hypothetical protein EV360DRAFT_90059 [Lentinula raphanica]|nr:hypothetical protein EV360DRAFT_90059 [Lentinula raphanica]